MPFCMKLGICAMTSASANCVCVFTATSHMQDAPYRRVRPENAFKPNPEPFDGTTTHKTAYVPFAVPVRAPVCVDVPASRLTCVRAHTPMHPYL